MTSLVKVFNDHLNEFIVNVSFIFEDKKALMQLKKYIKNLMLINSSKIIKLWYEYSIKYEKNIMNKDFEYFLNKNYTRDIKEDWMFKYIEHFQKELKYTSNSNKDKIMSYVLNLTKIAIMYKSN